MNGTDISVNESETFHKDEQEVDYTMNITDISFNKSDKLHENEEQLDYTLPAQLSTAISWLEVVFIVSLNIAVLCLISRENKKKSRMYFFLLHLAFADLCVGLLDVMPIAIERSVGLMYETTDVFLLGPVMCKIDRMVARTALLGSNFVLCAMSIDRALAIGKPLLRYGKGPLIQKSTIIISWATAILLSIPDAILSSIYVNDEAEHCMVRFGGTNDEIHFKWLVRFWTDYLFIFLVPALVIVISYTILLTIIFGRGILPGSTKGRSRSKSKEESSPDAPQVFDRRLPRSKMRSVKLTFGIVFGFIVCWTPYFFWNLLQLYGIVGHHPAITVCMTLRYLNSITNPIMFFIFHRRKVDSQQPSPLTSSTDQHLTTSLFTSFKNRLSLRKNNDAV